jgi:hypothetical protein
MLGNAGIAAVNDSPNRGPTETSQHLPGRRLIDKGLAL